MTAGPPVRTIRTFHGRNGRIGPAAAAAMERSWPRLGLAINGASTPLNLAAIFGPDTPVVLEIGPGMGDATAVLAARQPTVGVIAAEVHRAGVASLVRTCEALGLDNVRIAWGDGVRLLDTMIGVGTLAGFRAFFPDPWPKARHHKRRLVQPPFAVLLASRLRPGGSIHLATDSPGYAAQMMTVLTGTPTLRNSHRGFAPRPDWRPVTKYEERARSEGRPVFEVQFVRE